MNICGYCRGHLRRLDFHHVLDAVAAAQVTPEHCHEHVAMGESCFGHTTPSEVLVNYGSQSIAVKMLRMEKSPRKG